MWLRKGLPYLAFGALGVWGVVSALRGDRGGLFLAVIVYLVIGYDFIVDYEGNKPPGMAPTGRVPMRVALWPIGMFFSAQYYFERRREATRFCLIPGRLDRALDEYDEFAHWDEALATARERAKAAGHPYHLLDTARYVPVKDGGITRWGSALYVVDPTGRVERSWPW